MAMCAHCGRPIPPSPPTKRGGHMPAYCSTKCRRDFQNARRKVERIKQRGEWYGMRMCPTCGRQFLPREAEQFFCSYPCKRAARKADGSFSFCHDSLAEVWEEGRLPEEVTANALYDGGMAMPEEIDTVEYYRLKIAEAYRIRVSDMVRLTTTPPDPKEAEEAENDADL